MDRGIICGGFMESRPIEESDGKLREMVLKLQPQIEEKFNRKFEKLEPIEYRSQVVAGTNYYVKCHIGNDEYIHIKVFEPLPCHQQEPTVTSVNPEIKKLSDPLDHWRC